MGNLDLSLFNMLMEVCKLGVRMELGLGKHSKVRGASIVFNDLTVDVRFHADNLEFALYDLFNQFHDRDDVLKGDRHG